MGSKDITIPGTTPAAAAEALTKTGYNVKIQAEGGDTEEKLKKPKQKEVTEGDTLLDVFPELNQQVPEEGGEPIKVKATTPKLKKITLDKEVKPKGNKQVKKENKITTKSNVMDSLVTKKDLMEMIRFGQPAPATKPGQSPTIAPAKPSRRDKPERKNPFKPKHNPKPKGQMVFDETQSVGEELPNWLKSDKLGIGKTEMAEGYESGYMSPEQFKTAKAKLNSDLSTGKIDKEEYLEKYSDLNSKQLAGQKKATKDRKNNNTNESIVESIIKKTLNKK